MADRPRAGRHIVRTGGAATYSRADIALLADLIQLRMLLVGALDWRSPTPLQEA